MARSTGSISCYICPLYVNIVICSLSSFPAHCSSCHFDACDNCIKPYKSTFHPGHVMYKADSNVTYSRFNGGWRCDRCSRSFIPQVNNVPYHCSQCEFDLCASCMRTTGEASNSGKINFTIVTVVSKGLTGTITVHNLKFV